MRRSSAIESAAFYVGAGFFLAFGLWAFVDPNSFFAVVAPWNPYNEHLLRDAGAFSTGIGAALLASFTTRGGSVVALSGAASGATLHAVSHIIDFGEGGRPSDPYILGGLALLLLWALRLAWRRQS